MTHRFNEKQALSIEKINQFICQNVDKMFYLFGYAGTGKTFLISKIIQDLLTNQKMDQIFICAPTHKALNVIESYFKSNLNPTEKTEFITKINFMTIHKLLEFKPIIDNEDGSKIFKSMKESKFLKHMEDRLIVIDECSMISSGMIKEIEKYIDLYPIKVIFLGDSAQLPPVGEPDSLVFTKISKDYPYHIVLDEIMRTKSPDIKEVATIIRQWNRKDSLSKAVLSIHNKKSNTFKLYHKKSNYLQSTWFKKFISKLGSGDIPIILTWKNNTSDMYNKIIRQHVHQSTDLNNYQLGDYAMFNNYYMSPEDNTSFYTSDMIKILDINKRSEILFDWSVLYTVKPKTIIDKKLNILVKKILKLKNQFNIDAFTVERVHSDVNCVITGKQYYVQTICRDDLDEYKKFLEDIQEYIEFFFKKYKSDKYATKLWDIYHKRLVSPYAEISFGYSITTHKAQGSTFDTVIVDVDDISENPNLEEMQKMLYTAATRASSELGFLLA